MIDFAVLEAAVKAWVQSGTGLSAARVVRKDDKVPQVATPYATYKLNFPGHVGGRDEERWTNTPGSPSGQEVTVTIAGQREMMVSVQCFTKATVGGTDQDGNFTAKQYLSQLQTAVALPSVHDALAAAGLAFVDVLSASDFSEPLGPIGAGRAVLDVRFRLVDGASEFATYIQNVGGASPPVGGGVNPDSIFTPN